MPLPITDFDYDLPEELIAQSPAEPRDSSRLITLNRTERTISHGTFSDIPDLLRPHDLLVINNTRVIPANLTARRETGARVEVLLLQEASPDEWTALDREWAIVKEVLGSASIRS